jgi:hypothetical protein
MLQDTDAAALAVLQSTRPLPGVPMKHCPDVPESWPIASPVQELSLKEMTDHLPDEPHP